MLADAASGSSASPKPAEFSVLLVNDTSSLRLLKRRYLERAGYTVVESLDGWKTLAQMRESPIPLVVVMSTRIPRLDATGILQTVIAEPALQRHGFVLNTALARLLPGDLTSLTDYLHVPIVGKPFTEEELLTAVGSAVQRIRPAPIAPDHRADAEGE